MATHPPLPYSPDNEVVPASEDEDIRKVIEVLRALLERDAASSGKKRRDVHVKSHGCPAAQLRILPGLAPELQQGLFEREGTYTAAVRFSSASPMSKLDGAPDARGVAIKVQNVAGAFAQDGATDPVSQDFVMVNHPVFISRDVQDYLRLQLARLHGIRNPFAAVKAFTGANWNLRNWHWKELFTAARVLTRTPVHPVWQIYYSMVPIRFGNYVAKYRLRLLPENTRPERTVLAKLTSHSDALHMALEKTLREMSLRFEFQVQLRTSSHSMPLEDATVEWPESQSPFRTVAHLEIRQQELAVSPFGSGDDLAFSVWNSLAEHRPLGGINRVRRAVYSVSATWRGAN